MELDRVPPLVFVPEPVHEDAVHTLICPLCFHATSVWLASPAEHAVCGVCRSPFEAARGEA